jgi:murein DD-endopeptidase MepM/ murein hydrolase activator NlpD
MKPLFVFILLFSFMGCATTPDVRPVVPPGVSGIYHRVERKQIEKTTDFKQSSLTGFIPNRQQQQPVGIVPCDDFIWPMRGRVITAFGQTYNNMLNKGLNIQPYGNPDVFAARGGKVVFLTEDFGRFGKTIIIDHGEELSSVYSRNSQVFIHLADIVQKGTLIARVGSTKGDTNIYLHFQIRKGHIPQNPRYYLP